MISNPTSLGRITKTSPEEKLIERLREANEGRDFGHYSFSGFSDKEVRTMADYARISLSQKRVSFLNHHFARVLVEEDERRTREQVAPCWRGVAVVAGSVFFLTRKKGRK